MKKVIKAMKSTDQIPGKQTIWQHGSLVKEYLLDLVNFLEERPTTKEFKFPSWVIDYKAEIRRNLLSKKILARYSQYHDCGKPYVVEKDEFG